MSNKADLQRKLNDLGYAVGPFASKETLSNIVRLHSLTLESTNIDVAKLSDLELRRTLTENSVAVGPVTNHTRSIYQRKLLEVLTNETSEEQEDEIEIDAPISTTTPPSSSRSTRSSIGLPSSPGRSYLKETQEPRIPLTRVDVVEQNISSFYPNISTTKPKVDEFITNSYSSQRSSTKIDSRNSNISQPLRNPYDFQNDEPVVIRHEHKATPFRTANDVLSNNTNRFTKLSDTQSSTRSTFSSEGDINELRARIFGKTNEQKDLSTNKEPATIKKPTINDDFEPKKVTNNGKLDVAVKNNGTYLYTGITVAVALVVFVVYMILVK